MQLRGAFNPLFQLAYAAVVAVAAVSVLLLVSQWATSQPSARGDIACTPWFFLAGLLLGGVIGRYRLRALRQSLPEVSGRFLLSQRGVLMKLPDGDRAIGLQRLGIALAALAWFAATTYTDGRWNLFASMCLYILGQLLTGQTLPFLLLWREIRSANPASPAG